MAQQNTLGDARQRRAVPTAARWMNRFIRTITAMPFRVTALGLLLLYCVSVAPASAQVNGDRIELIQNPVPTSGSIFATVLVPPFTTVNNAEADFLLTEGTTESMEFLATVTDTILGYAAAKTQILLSDNKGISDALVVTKIPGGSGLDFIFTSDTEDPLNPINFSGSNTLIPETGNTTFPGVGAEGLLNVTSLVFPNAPVDATLPFTVLVGSDRDVPEPTSMSLVVGGLFILAMIQMRRRSSKSKGC